MPVVTREGFLVDENTGEVLDDEYRFVYERYDNLVPFQPRTRQNEHVKIQTIDDLDVMISILESRIEDERIKEKFVELAKRAKKFGLAGIVAAYAVAHYMNGVSVKLNRLRDEFGLTYSRYRVARKALQMMVRRSVDDIDRQVLERLREEAEASGLDFEMLKAKYYDLKNRGLLSGKTVKSRVVAVLKTAKKRQAKVVPMADQTHIICPICGAPGKLALLNGKYYIVEHHDRPASTWHYLGLRSNVVLVKKPMKKQNNT